MRVSEGNSRSRGGLWLVLLLLAAFILGNFLGEAGDSEQSRRTGVQSQMEVPQTVRERQTMRTVRESLAREHGAGLKEGEGR